MSLDKAIEHHKEHRKPYIKAKAKDATCRNHGSCAYCHANRTHNAAIKLEATNEQLNDYKKG